MSEPDGKSIKWMHGQLKCRHFIPLPREFLLQIRLSLSFFLDLPGALARFLLGFQIKYKLIMESQLFHGISRHLLTFFWSLKIFH